jgi:hypothetical protein
VQSRATSSWTALRRGRAAATLLALIAALTVAPAAVAEPIVELVTIGAGDAIWTRYGHTALRVHDPASGRDRVYNYGYAPFGEPSFIWHFLRGEAYFFLGVSSWTETLGDYRSENRTIELQRLHLTRAQTSELVQRLRWNARPENREFRYDHHLDNCSTRVRDLLDDVTQGALRRAVEGWDPDRSYRTYTLDGARGRLEVAIGMDILGGLSQERRVDGWAELYLPVYLQQAVAAAELEVDGETRPLAGPIEVVYQRRGPPALQGSRYRGRWVVVASGLVLALALILLGWLARRWGGVWPRLAGLLVLAVALFSGLVGVILAGLMAISRLPDFRWNENVLIFLPLDLALVGTAFRWLVLGRRWIGRWLRAYLDLRLVSLALLAVLKPIGLMPQDNWAFLAFMGVVIVGLRLGLAGKSTQPLAAAA